MNILKIIYNKIIYKKSNQINNNNNNRKNQDKNNNTNNNNNNNNQIINKNQIINEILFFKVFRSIVLFNQIFYHVALYRENYSKSFISDSTFFGYRFREYISVLNYDIIGQALEIGVIPQSVTCLSIGFYGKSRCGSIDALIKEKSIPDSVNSLKIKGHYNEPFGVGVLPSSIQILTLNDSFDCAIERNVLPYSLCSLTFGFSFNQSLDSQFLNHLSSLTLLDLGGNFNSPINPNTLPNSILVLKLSQSFNQDLKIGSLPSQLKAIEFRSHFNRPLQPFVLPSSVTEITFGSSFNESINCANIIPPNVTKLCLLNSNYSHQLRKEFFPSVKKLILYKNKSKSTTYFTSNSLSENNNYY